MQQVLTVANVLTTVRLVLAFPIIYFLAAGVRSAAVLVLFGLAALTDLLDGYFARKRNEETSLGRILDPVADKILVVGTLLALTVSGSIPLAWILILGGKELALILGGAVLLGKARGVIKARFLGKAATAILLCGVLLILVSLEHVGRTAIGVGILVSLAAGVDYLLVALRWRSETNV